MRKRTDARGFSLLEMLVSIAILLIVAGAAFSGLNSYQKVYTSEQLKTDLHSTLRSTMELISQEIGQAGALNFTSRTLGANVSASAVAQSVALSPVPATDVFVGEILSVDTGASNELVQVTAVTSTAVTGIFHVSHSIGAAVVAMGTFPQGVLSAAPNTPSDANHLKLFGDINGDGTLVYVEYICNAAAGTLTRSDTPISSVTINPAQMLISDLVANPNGAPCFQYPTAVSSGGFTFTPSVGVTLTVQTSERNPETGQPLTMTKSFLNLAPRNVLAGINLANAGSTSNLQQTPTEVTTLSAY